MDSYFLIGAILGSGLFLAFGRGPARRLVALVKAKAGRGR